MNFEYGFFIFMGVLASAFIILAVYGLARAVYRKSKVLVVVCSGELKRRDTKKVVFSCSIPVVLMAFYALFIYNPVVGEWEYDSSKGSYLGVNCSKIVFARSAMSCDERHIAVDYAVSGKYITVKTGYGSSGYERTFKSNGFWPTELRMNGVVYVRE